MKRKSNPETEIRTESGEMWLNYRTVLDYIIICIIKGFFNKFNPTDFKILVTVLLNLLY